MRSQNDKPPWNVRALLESTATPFTVANYPPRAAIFRQGDPCDSVIHIETGRVWLAVTSRGGKEAICGVLNSGAFLGEEALTDCSERRHSAIALTPTQVLVVAKVHMIRLLAAQRGLLDQLLEHLLARNIRLDNDLTDQLLCACEQRLAHVLLTLADCGGGGARLCLLPHVSQDIIAEMVGTTRSRVNFFMGKFKKLGFLEEGSGELLVNAARLHVIDHDDGRISAAGR